VVRGRLTETRPVWLVTRYDDVRDGLRDSRFGSSPAAIEGYTGEDPRRTLVDTVPCSSGERAGAPGSACAGRAGRPGRCWMVLVVLDAPAGSREA
jgi:hypothetical protein